ncbi:hypothetical protein QQP08_004477 [Theobroma cacao]|nr:hypothetical protein QQP08_004477 [Theobroma cacao]
MCTTYPEANQHPVETIRSTQFFKGEAHEGNLAAASLQSFHNFNLVMSSLSGRNESKFDGKRTKMEHEKSLIQAPFLSFLLSRLR